MRAYRPGGRLARVSRGLSSATAVASLAAAVLWLAFGGLGDPAAAQPVHGPILYAMALLLLATAVTFGGWFCRARANLEPLLAPESPGLPWRAAQALWQHSQPRTIPVDPCAQPVAGRSTFVSCWWGLVVATALLDAALFVAQPGLAGDLRLARLITLPAHVITALAGVVTATLIQVVEARQEDRRDRIEALSRAARREP